MAEEENNQPEFYQEHITKKFIFGPAMQHDGSTDSAVAIAKWLNQNQVSASAVPAYGDFPAMVRIDHTFSRDILFPNDWAIIHQGGTSPKPFVFHDSEFADRFAPRDEMINYDELREPFEHRDRGMRS